MESLEETAGQFLDGNYTCAQSVFKAVQLVDPRLEGIDASMFAGFGGGFARTGRVCGAVVAATALLSRRIMERRGEFDRSELNGVLQRFYGEVVDQFGALECRAITGIDFQDPEDSKRYAAEAHHQKCRPLVGFVAGRVATLSDGRPS